MEQQTSSNSPVANNYDNSYNYGQYSTFLPNVSPSASSLDSGYCGPASVQSMHSSIDSPHNNLGYPSSPWTTDLTVGDLANWLTTNYIILNWKLTYVRFFPFIIHNVLPLFSWNLFHTTYSWNIKWQNAWAWVSLI